VHPTCHETRSRRRSVHSQRRQGFGYARSLGGRRRRGTLNPEDLLQEALARSIEGSRSCRANIDVVRFLAETIRSIASDTMTVRDRQPEFPAVPLVGEHGMIAGIPDPTQSRSRAPRVVDRFTEWMEAMSGPEDKDRQGMERLESALIQDVLATSDEDILAESMQDGTDPEAIATDGRALFEKTVAARENGGWLLPRLLSPRIAAEPLRQRRPIRSTHTRCLIDGAQA
jgi:DNA-directed RNA polymerase specialized sigma24 family protein